MERCLWAEHPIRGGRNYKKCKFRPNKNCGERGNAMSRDFSAQILRGPFIIIPEKCWRDSYGRNTPSEEVENIKNVKFDLIKILESAEGLCLGF